jgi:uncharacterized protein (TIGR00255 family)
MTGYCSLNEQLQLSVCGAVGVTIELKTLNGRFLEVVAKLPSGLSRLEIPLSNLLQEKLLRGRVYFNMRFSDSSRTLTTMMPAWSTIDNYVQASKDIKKKYHFEQELTLVDLMQLPDVFAAQEGGLSAEDEKAILALIAKAADALMRMRKEEGERLEQDFVNIFAMCATKINDIEQASQQVVEQYKAELHQAIAANQHSDKPDVHIEELQVALRKIDIHEEITRFKSHLASIDPILKSPQFEKGKKLDFILQELLRETNTMMAKSPSYQVSTAGIDIKVELEKAREQIQNIV